MSSTSRPGNAQTVQGRGEAFAHGSLARRLQAFYGAWRRPGGHRGLLRSLLSLERRQDLLEDLGGLGSWRMDGRGGSWNWSAGARALFGLRSGGAVPSPSRFVDRIHHEDRAAWLAAVERARIDGIAFELTFRWPADDGWLWIRAAGRPTGDGEIRPRRVVGIFQDVSASRAQASVHADNEARLRELVHMSADWYWESDAEHRVTLLSSGAEPALGAWVREALGRPCWELPAGTPVRGFGSAHRATLDARQPFTDHRISRITPTGELVHLSITGRPVFDRHGLFTGYRGTGRNVTRQWERHTLLAIEGEIAAAMRDQADAERVVDALLRAVHVAMDWCGGLHVQPLPERGLAPRERAGTPGFMQAMAGLPDLLAIEPGSVEANVLAHGRAVWVPDLDAAPGFARRWQAQAVGARAAFVVPLLDERGRTTSMLLFLAPAGFRADAFLEQLADRLSRSMSLWLQRQSAQRRLLHASLHDPLTDLPNRAHLMQRLERHLSRGERLAVLYIDLDRYKPVNDRFGHAVGDLVLIEIARRLRAELRPRDLAGRLGGDEFLVLLDAPGGRADAEVAARRLLAAIERPVQVGEHAHSLSASIGVALTPPEGIDAPALLARADRAMYRVKAAGRAGVAFADEDR